MRNKLRAYWVKVDKALLLAILVGAIAAWPFFTYPGLPRDTDAELHIFRIAELGYSLRAGNPYPRWAPDFYHGYGYPIFNYYAPLSYHVGNWLTGFTPEAAESGAKRLFVLAHIAGALGAYLLGRVFGGQGGGLLGATAFAFSPYIFLINPHVRGDLAEVVALALLPWVLWSWELLWRCGGKRNLFLAVISAVALLLSHNLTGLTMMALLILLSAWHWLVLGQNSAFKWGLSAGVLITGLTAYFWLPFLLEQSLVQLQNVAGDGHYDFRNHFILLQDLLATLSPIDWRSTSFQIPFTVHPLLVGLAILGLGIVLIFRREKFRSVLFYAIAASLCFWLITVQSEAVWTYIPGLSFYQFPWRFLGPLAALLVPLIASIVHIQLSEHRQSLLVAILICLIIGFMLPGLYVPPWESGFAQTDKLTFLAFENQGRWRGTTSTSDFVPQTVDVIPAPEPSVLASYKSPPIDRVNRHTLPEGTQVTVLPDVPWRNHFEVETPTAFILRLYLFYFPGWTAYVDGEKVPIEVAHPEGFVTVEIPPGNHKVVVQFQDTLPRKLGWGIALIASVVFVGVIYYVPSYGKNNAEIYTRDHTAIVYSMLGIVVVICLKVLLLDATEWLKYTSPEGEALAASYAQKANFGGEILLLGFDVSHRKLNPGERVDVTLYWNAQQPLTQTYQSFVHLLYPEGKIWTQSDHLNPAGFPTNLWPTDRYICDTHTLTLPEDMPPGNYLLSIGLYTLNDARRLPILWAERGKRADHIILSQSITVRK